MQIDEPPKEVLIKPCASGFQLTLVDAAHCWTLGLATARRLFRNPATAKAICEAIDKHDAEQYLKNQNKNQPK